MYSPDMGRITLKSNALHYHYFQEFGISITITITKFSKSNALHYHYLGQVMHYNYTLLFEQKQNPEKKNKKKKSLINKKTKI